VDGQRIGGHLELKKKPRLFHSKATGMAVLFAVAYAFIVGIHYHPQGNNVFAGLLGLVIK
jgi:hypothetical protein